MLDIDTEGPRAMAAASNPVFRPRSSASRWDYFGMKLWGKQRPLGWKSGPASPEDAESENASVPVSASGDRVSPLLPDDEVSLEDRIKGLEHRLKAFQVLVAVIAVAAPIFSAVAAFRSADAAQSSADTANQSLETAREAKNISEQMKAIAQAQFATAGALLQMNPVIDVRGTCNPPPPQPGVRNHGPARAVVHIRNLGRAGVNLTWLSVTTRVDLPEGVWWVTVASHNEAIELEGQHGFDAEMPLDCSELARNDLQNDPGERLIDFVKRKPDYLTINWYGPSVGQQVTTVTGVQRNG